VTLSAPFKSLLVALALVVGGASLTLLHLDNRRLQRRVAEAATRNREVARLHDDNARLDRLLAAQREGADSARARVRQDVEQLRTEIAALERKAEHERAARLAITARETAMLEANRDPRQGPARLEFFQNRGQATPSAAFETLVWAALKGNESTLADVTTLNSATRAKAEQLLAQLPADSRAQWTPQKLGQLWFTGLFTELPSLEILGETLVAADEASLQIRLRDGAEEKLALRLTPTGWKVLIPTAAFDHLSKKLQPPSK
jgi:hypothetical protein